MKKREKTMNDKRFVASKRDIILFSIISSFAFIFFIFPFSEPSNYLENILEIIIILLLLFLPEILAIIINKIIEHYNIQSKKWLLITKILFNIFTVINFAFWCFMVILFNSISHWFDSIE